LDNAWQTVFKELPKPNHIVDWMMVHKFLTFQTLIKV